MLRLFLISRYLLLKAFVICYIGNILPIPFILLFIRKIFQFLKRFSGTRKIVEKLEVRSMRQSEKVKRWRNWGLLLFVAVPLPGTGGWTGALIAALLDIRVSNSLMLQHCANFCGRTQFAPTVVKPTS